MRKARNLEEAVRLNIMAGGDNCSRSFVIGAAFGAIAPSLPESWIENTKPQLWGDIDNEVDKVRLTAFILYSLKKFNISLKLTGNLIILFIVTNNCRSYRIMRSFKDNITVLYLLLLYRIIYFYCFMHQQSAAYFYVLLICSCDSQN